jgi:ABC-type Fe3+-hydroxamate transport system substrate-binding protein
MNLASSLSKYLPQRIACLSTESVEVLYALGEEASHCRDFRLHHATRAGAQGETKISGFSTARIDKILAVKPDLVLAFSDLQSDICRDLVKAGIAVHHFNQRSVAEILAMIRHSRQPGRGTGSRSATGGKARSADRHLCVPLPPRYRVAQARVF